MAEPFVPTTNTPVAITIEIGALALPGQSNFDADTFGVALQAELGRLLGDGSLPGTSARDWRVDHLAIPPPDTPPPDPATWLGVQVAQAVHHQLTARPDPAQRAEPTRW